MTFTHLKQVAGIPRNGWRVLFSLRSQWGYSIGRMCVLSLFVTSRLLKASWFFNQSFKVNAPEKNTCLIVLERTYCSLDDITNHWFLHMVQQLMFLITRKYCLDVRRVGVLLTKNTINPKLPCKRAIIPHHCLTYSINQNRYRKENISPMISISVAFGAKNVT